MLFSAAYSLLLLLFVFVFFLRYEFDEQKREFHLYLYLILDVLRIVQKKNEFHLLFLVYTCLLTVFFPHMIPKLINSIGYLGLILIFTTITLKNDTNLHSLFPVYIRFSPVVFFL